MEKRHVRLSFVAVGMVGATLFSAPAANAGPVEDARAVVNANRGGCAPMQWNPAVERAAQAANTAYAANPGNLAGASKYLADQGVKVTGAMFILATGLHTEDALRDLTAKRASMGECFFTQAGVSHLRPDFADGTHQTKISVPGPVPGQFVKVGVGEEYRQYNQFVVILAGPPVADKPAEPKKPDPKVVTTIDPKVAPTLFQNDLTYSLKATGLPVSSINISYLGANGQVVTENNVVVTAGWTWTRTVRAKEDPWLKVSVNSAGLAGLNLTCSATTSSPLIAAKPGAPSKNKAGTISFPGGLNAEPAKSCG